MTPTTNRRSLPHAARPVPPSPDPDVVTGDGWRATVWTDAGGVTLRIEGLPTFMIWELEPGLLVRFDPDGAAPGSSG